MSSSAFHQTADSVLRGDPPFAQKRTAPAETRREQHSRILRRATPEADTANGGGCSCRRRKGERKTTRRPVRCSLKIQHARPSIHPREPPPLLSRTQKKPKRKERRCLSFHATSCLLLSSSIRLRGSKPTSPHLPPPDEHDSQLKTPPIRSNQSLSLGLPQTGNLFAGSPFSAAAISCSTPPRPPRCPPRRSPFFSPQPPPPF